MTYAKFSEKLTFLTPSYAQLTQKPNKLTDFCMGGTLVIIGINVDPFFYKI